MIKNSWNVSSILLRIYLICNPSFNFHNFSEIVLQNRRWHCALKWLRKWNPFMIWRKQLRRISDRTNNQVKAQVNLNLMSHQPKYPPLTSKELQGKRAPTRSLMSTSSETQVHPSKAGARRKSTASRLRHQLNQSLLVLARQIWTAAWIQNFLWRWNTLSTSLAIGYLPLRLIWHRKYQSLSKMHWIEKPLEQEQVKLSRLSRLILLHQSLSKK